MFSLRLLRFAVLLSTLAMFTKAEEVSNVRGHLIDRWCWYDNNFTALGKDEPAKLVFLN